jgi:ATP-binding cassette, subfamily B, bacterial MsbA
MSQASAPIGLSHLVGYAKPYKWIALVAALGMALEASVASGFTYLMKNMLDDVLGAKDARWSTILPWAILALFALRALGVYIGDMGAAKIARGIVRTQRARCFEHYLKLPTLFFARNPAGPLISRLTADVEQLGYACSEGIKVILTDSLLIIGMLIVMLLTSVKLTLTVLIVGPLIGLIVSVVSKRYRRLSRSIQDSLGNVTDRAQTVIQGERDVKLFGAAAQEMASFEQVNAHNYRQQMKITQTNAISTSIVQFLAAGALALVIFVAARQGQSSDLTPGEFMRFITSMLLILPSLKRLTTVQNLFGRGVAAAGSIEALLAEPIEHDAGKHVLSHVRGELALKNICLCYPDASTFALDQIHLTLNPGTVMALVGRSGSGKTSLAQVIARLVSPTDGQLLLDGEDVQNIQLASLRSHIAWVGQTVVLNGLTVADNVAYGAKSIDRARVIEALKLAHADAFVAALPKGIDTELGSNAASLSGGQRQRIALARAIYKRAKILILDEATSALDNESERAVQAALQTLKKDCTTLIIAHRLSTIEQADQIVVMDQGQIKQIGTHEQLMALPGIYKNLHLSGFSQSI